MHTSVKHAVCVLLALLLCAFAGCSAGEPEAASSSADSSEVEGETSEEPFVEAPEIAAARAYLSGGAPDRTLKATNLFADAPYTYSEQPSESYADPNLSKLHDGITRELFDQYNWVGFQRSKAPSVTFDLGEGAHALADVEVDCLRQVSYGIELPRQVAVSVSEDGETFTQIGALLSPSDTAESSKYVYRFAFPETVSARYVRITFTPGSQSFLFVDEITGYEYSENGTIDVSAGQTAQDLSLEYDYYEYALRKDISVSVNASDADYSLRQNLALLSGVEVQAQHFDPLDKTALANNNSSKADLARLTDGASASVASYTDAAFVRFSRGYGRNLVVDLGNEMAVDEVHMQFLNQITVGVGAPPVLSVSVSCDGEDWVTVYADAFLPYGDRTPELKTVEAVFSSAVRCRYVRVSFPTVPHNETSSMVFLSEIEVYGRKNTEGVPEAVDDLTLRMGNYPDPAAIGCENILFACIGSNNALDQGTAAGLLRYVDATGTQKELFMDSVCFSTAGDFAYRKDLKDSADDFRALCFAEGKNLNALQAAAADLRRGLPETPKPTVWLNLLCPRADDVCADVDGDGQAEDLSTAEGRFAFLRYQVDQMIAQFASADYADLTLVGFYWNDECLFPEDLEVNAASVRMINEYIHSLGYKSFWCPYFNAYGTWMWADVGFDFAILQPNYMFYAAEDTRLQTAATFARMLGMGVELELEDYEGEGAVKLYREYLRAGYDSGFMHSIKLYYQGGLPGAIGGSRSSDTALGRSVYDDTYAFAKGLLDDTYNTSGGEVSLDAFEDVHVTVKEGNAVRYELGEGADAVTMRIVQSPVFGAFRLNRSGNGTYNAPTGFRGEETALIEISDETGNRKIVRVTITVE